MPPIIPTNEYAIQKLVERQKKGAKPFCSWSVWQRNEDCDESVGPEGFSFFYICAEISALYQGLYNRLSIKPAIIAIIQPGSIIDEWSPTEFDGSFLNCVALANPAGMPEYLLYGGDGRSRKYREACWAEYQGERIAKLPEKHTGLWKLNTTA